MRRTGFTLIEVVIALAVMGMLAMILMPKVGTIMEHDRVNRAATVVASDLEQAVTIAGRERKPVRLTCTCATAQYTVVDRSGGTSRLSRKLGTNSEYHLTTLTFSTPSVDIFPTGVTSADLTVTVGSAGYSRQIRLTTAGYVRIVPP